MLDTNVCIYVMNKKPIPYLQKLKIVEKNNSVVISSIALAELQYGVSNSSNQNKKQNQINLDAFLNKVEVISFSAKCAFYYGELRSMLEKKGTIIGSNDLLIASHVLAENATLVTNNIKEFKRIPNLILENWDK
ncbi:MAG: PIN domain-containing protein [Rickettsia endosymbiont of Ixodes persulcatus]|nr:PIN domain-containing protein [Rickettsia endosymbiont of Ixodes persulcatus]MCZ6902229.1 PIN domain-containing protein [Rickettsia endosymbiont of Ixodes persulcatus]MCZ6902944.1 PIN domain-containing protein [Rickettsia endosymbiont of Ixodes persulcatus]MCZ6908582.1 PIN domain-containing protein [Rickettsia endosymbiont of Ixodes persulcatus]MCZ6909966.1 PIN domain-containing protein [Rickettsia endosymbiont of Ixodes persulcatus]